MKERIKGEILSERHKDVIEIEKEKQKKELKEGRMKL